MNPAEIREAAQRISKARAQLILSTPFHATLALRLELRPDERAATIATDGRRLYYNPTWIIAQKPNHLVTIIAHEAMHCSLNHQTRRGARDPERFNIACLSWGTRVTLADGTTDAIQRIVPGDFVATPIGPSRVLATVFNGWRETVWMEFGDRFVICTPDHQFATSGGFAGATEISDAAGYGYIYRHSGRAGVRAGELQENDDGGSQQRNGGGLRLGGSVSLQARSVCEQVFAKAAQLSRAQLAHGAAIRLLCGAGGRGGDGQRLPLSARLLAPRPQRSEHVTSADAVDERLGLFGGASSQQHWPFVLSDRGFWLSTGDAIAAHVALSDRQKTARARIAASVGDPEDAALSGEGRDDICGRGNAGGYSAVEQARGKVRARARQLLPVFDLVTEAGIFFAGGVLTHNCDHAVNLILNEPVRDPNGGGVLYRFEMPEHATMDKKFAGMAAEAIYPLIPEPAKQRKGAAGQGQPVAGDGSMPDYGGTGCVIDPKGDDGKAMTEAERDELERDWKVATLQAAQAAKAQGKMPGGIEQLIDSIRNPKVDWRAALREFVRQSARNDYSWRRPNVRFLASGDYLPSLWDETTGPIAMGVDTSGSVGDDELAAVCAELNGCLDTARPESVDVVYADAVVQGHERFTPDSYPVKMNVKGRGGTDLSGIWPYLAEHEIEPVCAIVTTDMELRRRDLGEEPPFPVLFLSTGRDAPMDGPLPFGTLVKLELDA